MQKILSITTTAILCWLACTAKASQAGATHYVSGEFSDFSGYSAAAPGWYAANFFLGYNDATFNKEIPFGNRDEDLASGVTVNTAAEVPILIYAYPFDFLGGTLSSGVGIPYVWLSVKAKGTLFDETKSVTQTDTGLGDMQLIPVSVGWTNGDFHFSGLFNVWAPTGSYKTTSIANTGLGYWTFEPMLGLGWLSSKIGTEASVFTAVDFNTENYDADYQSGDIFHVDGTVAQHLPLFGGIAGAGVTAFYLHQITGDSGPGAKLGSFQMKSYGVGPTLSYVHAIGKSTLVVDASWLPQTQTENTVKGAFVWVKAALSF